MLARLKVPHGKASRGGYLWLQWLQWLRGGGDVEDHPRHAAAHALEHAAGALVEGSDRDRHPGQVRGVPKGRRGGGGRAGR